MTVIRRGAEKLGSYTMKKVFTQTIPADQNAENNEQCLALVHFPHYTHPGYVWCDIDVVGHKEGHEPEHFMELAIRGSLTQTPMFWDTNYQTDNWETKMQYSAPTDPDTFDAGGVATDVGITGREHRVPAGHEFFRREQMLGLPNTAYPSDAEKMTYKTHFKYKGHARTPAACAIEYPKMMSFGVIATIPNLLDGASNNDNNSLVDSGNYTDNEAHYQALVDNLPSKNNAPPTLGDSDALPGDLEAYLYHGLRHGTESAVADDLYIRMYLTVRLDVYSPKHGSYVPSP